MPGSLDQQSAPERSAGCGSDGNPVPARTESDLRGAVVADGDLERLSANWQDERERLAEERRKFEAAGGGMIGIMIHANPDQTGWAMATVCDENLPAIFLKCLIPSDVNVQSLAIKEPVTNGAGKVEKSIPWNGHIPLVASNTGRFLGWTTPPPYSPLTCLSFRKRMVVVARMFWQALKGRS